MLNKFHDENAEVIGISKDSQKSHMSFYEKHNLKIIILSDPEKIIHKLYGSWGLKKLYGKESMGTIRSTFMIDPDGKLVHSWKNVRIKGHVEEVYKKLIELKK